MAGGFGGHGRVLAHSPKGVSFRATQPWIPPGAGHRRSTEEDQVASAWVARERESGPRARSLSMTEGQVHNTDPAAVEVCRTRRRPPARREPTQLAAPASHDHGIALSCRSGLCYGHAGSEGPRCPQGWWQDLDRLPGTRPHRRGADAVGREFRPVRRRRAGDAYADDRHRPKQARQSHRLRQRGLHEAHRLRPGGDPRSELPLPPGSGDQPLRRHPDTGRHRATRAHRDRAPQPQEGRRGLLEPPPRLAGVRSQRRADPLLRLAVRRHAGAGQAQAPPRRARRVGGRGRTAQGGARPDR
ncbi:hypothetical protein NBEOAGPD_4720 [Methylobacterium gregans]|uniref:Uncharacterized protein n=1 Tax=Methylobacterium gregans TaxID=374424 RepID=A0AA37HTP4_9HYPH|nr:hypothetical protein NBEOAGPD_4720 [Methylobacterium gregans]